MNRLQQHYINTIRSDLVSKFNYKTAKDIPEIKKITINMGIKTAVENKRHVLPGLLGLELISGQKAIVTKAKKSISTFKLREEMPIGCKVTLRNDDIYDFLDNFLHISIYKLRDFKGFKHIKMDQEGNLSFGVENILIFPQMEHQYDKFSRVTGISISIVTTAKTDEEGKALLSGFQIPFK